MTKRQLIDQILSLNETADPGFLAEFQDRDLDEYLTHLTKAKMPRGRGPGTCRRRDLREHVRPGKFTSAPVPVIVSRREPIIADIAMARGDAYVPA